MLTPDYFAQPDLTRSCLRLLAIDLLLILENESSQKAPSRLLSRRQKIINEGIKYLKLLHTGFNVSNYGRYSVLFPESVETFQELSDLLGPEAKGRHFPIQLEDYSKTLETLSSGQQPAPQKINELKGFLNRITPYYDKYDKKGSSQTDAAPVLKGLSYVSP